MSFEDDMIEYGFSDANDYMDYLMDEADKVYEEQKQWHEELWPNCERDYSIHNDTNFRVADGGDVDEMFIYEKDAIEDILERGERNKIKDRIILLWEKENPIKAKLWNAYYVQSLEINPKPLSEYSYRYEEKYTLWEKWLEKIDGYEEFKVKNSAKWKEYQERIYASYIIAAAKKWAGIDDFLEMDSYITFDSYKKLLVWIDSNILLWNDGIVLQYASLVDHEKITPLKGWGNVYEWRKDFEVWKKKNPILWIVKKKEWQNSFKKMYVWINENKEVWDNWKIKNLSLWSECYAKYEKALWAIYTEKAWEEFQRVINCGSFEKKTQDMSEDLRSTMWRYIHFRRLREKDINYWLDKSSMNTNEEKELFIKTHCSEYEFKTFFKKKRQNMNFYLKHNNFAENYADKKIMKLWIKKNNKQWNDWIYHYLKNEYKYIDVLQYKLKDYYDTWEKLYPRKYKSWVDKGYKEWRTCTEKIEIWLLWLSDGNAYFFDEWAKLNIPNWEERKDEVMENDLSYAYNIIIGKKGSYDKLPFKDWRNNHPDEWTYWKDAIYDCLIRNKCQNEYRQINQQGLKVKIKINELRYWSQLGYRVFIEGMGIIEMDNKFGFFNETGEIVVPLIYDAVKEFHNGYAPVCTKKSFIEHDFFGDCLVERELWSIVDKKGVLAIQSTYDKIEQITESFAVFVKDGCHGIVEFTSGKETIFPITYDSIRILDNGMWVARDKDYDEFGWAVLSQSGDNITPFKYSYIFNSNNDLAMVVKNAVLSDNNNGYIWGEWGYVDKNGNEVEELKEFDSPYSFEKYWIDRHKNYETII